MSKPKLSIDIKHVFDYGDDPAVDATSVQYFIDHKVPIEINFIGETRMKDKVFNLRTLDSTTTKLELLGYCLLNVVLNASESEADYLSYITSIVTLLVEKSVNKLESVGTLSNVQVLEDIVDLYKAYLSGETYVAYMEFKDVKSKFLH